MVKDLNERFGIPNVLLFELDSHGMERAVVKTPQAEAIIYLQGAHITHFQPTGEKPVLFLSSKSNFARGKAIRGGIPIIYPWFGAKGDDPKAPMHGFARTAQWEFNFADLYDGVLELVFSLNTAGHSNFKYVVWIGERLELDSVISNASSKPLLIEVAFHSYFAVSDLRQVRVHGLAGKNFIDKTDAFQRKVQTTDLLQVTCEIDRVYVNTRDVCILDDPGYRRRIIVDKEHSSTTVVWNPWIEKSKTMGDLAPDEWQKMLCIETANAADDAITLQPGETHQMSTTISLM